MSILARPEPARCSSIHPSHPMAAISNTRIAFGTGRDTTTGPASALVGYPYPAKPCRCPVPWVEDDGCCRCGYWLEDVIRATWGAQARRMARVANRPPVVVPDRARYPSVRRRNVSPELAGVAS